MTVILVDLGNTALKWATSDDPEQPHTFVHCGSNTLPEGLIEEWFSLRPSRMVGCMVSSEPLALSMARIFNRANIKWDWLHSEPMFDGEDFRLYNRYENTAQLGSDRWYAAIGAASLYKNQAVIVVHMGTATTVDTVLPCADGQEFVGGMILPGPAMMYKSLVKNTHCRQDGVGKRCDFPNNTRDAISNGILEAHLGVIERACHMVHARGFTPNIVFAGGAAPILAPYITEQHPQAVRKHNLVLRGLSLCAKYMSVD